MQIISYRLVLTNRTTLPIHYDLALYTPRTDNRPPAAVQCPSSVVTLGLTEQLYPTVIVRCYITKECLESGKKDFRRNNIIIYLKYASIIVYSCPCTLARVQYHIILYYLASSRFILF